MKETLLYLRMNVEEVTTHVASEPVPGPLLHYPQHALCQVGTYLFYDLVMFSFVT